MKTSTLGIWGGTTAALALVLAGAGCSRPKPESASASTISWHRSFDAALADAGRAGRPILLDFYTDW